MFINVEVSTRKKKQIKSRVMSGKQRKRVKKGASACGLKNYK